MTARSKAYWNNLLLTGYEITQADWVDLVDTFTLYRPSTEPVISASTLTLDLGGSAQGAFEPRTSVGTRIISSNFTLAFSNVATTDLISAVFSFTGTVIITMPADVEVSNPSSIGSWDSGLGELTITAGTADVIEFQFIWDATEAIWLLKVSEVSS
jgi:hypothetical protein